MGSWGCNPTDRGYFTPSITGRDPPCKEEVLFFSLLMAQTLDVLSPVRIGLWPWLVNGGDPSTTYWDDPLRIGRSRGWKSPRKLPAWNNEKNRKRDCQAQLLRWNSAVSGPEVVDFVFWNHELKNRFFTTTTTTTTITTTTTTTTTTTATHIATPTATALWLVLRLLYSK